MAKIRVIRVKNPLSASYLVSNYAS